MTVCAFRVCRRRGVVEPTFYITDNTDFDDVRTLEVAPFEGVRLCFDSYGGQLTATAATFSPMELPRLMWSQMEVRTQGWLVKRGRKPKADKGPKQNASNPSTKPGGIKGLENMRNG